jgi:hypothetical protein
MPAGSVQNNKNAEGFYTAPRFQASRSAGWRYGGPY